MKQFIQSSAEDDILRQFNWYVEQELPKTARRFRGAVAESITALVAMPLAGAPRYVSNAQLAGLRTWPVKGFDEFRVYYIPQSDLVAVIRILHDKRDIGSILEQQTVEDPRPH